MGAADLKARKAIERSVEDHAGKKKGGLERIADDIPEIAKRAFPDDIGRVLRMNEDQNSKLLRLRPERIVFRRRRHFAGNMPTDSNAAQTEILDGVVQLFGSHLGMLQSDRGETCKAVRMRLAPCGESFILSFDDLPRQISIRFVPPCALMA